MKYIDKQVAVAQKQEESSATTSVSGSPPSKENVSDNTKVSNLNLSGTLITSFTPQKANSTRASSRTPSTKKPATPMTTPKTPLKDDAEEDSCIEASPCVRITKSMFLIDLVTPAPTRGRSRSTSTSTTPSKATSEKKRTPLSAKKTPTVRTASKNETLLKSAIKNSSIKKRLNESTTTPTTAKGRVLFAPSPILDVSNDSSVVSVSFCSAEEGPSDQSMTKENEITVEERMIDATEEQNDNDKESQQVVTSDDETKQLLEKISIVIEEDNAAKSEKITPEKDDNQAQNIESQRTPDIEARFATLAANATPANTTLCKSVFNIDTPSQASAEADFEKIATPPKDEKVESLLNWIENTRETISSNVTEQILSSRYSNITPNDSITSTVANTSTAYDAKTPKMSILETVNSVSLTVSPVTRLSIGDNATTTVENYNLNTDIPKSLRSTRKRIGNAMASLHDMSQNIADSTIDMNESLNVSKIDQSLLEVTSNNILSLDAQPMEAEVKEEEIERDENAENIPPPSNNFIAFAEHNHEGNGTEEDDDREFFEISNSDIEDEDISSSSSEEEEILESDEEESDIETIVVSSQDLTPKPSIANDFDPKNAVIKFRLSEQDLEEDGINPLDISLRTDEESENAAQMEADEEEIEIPATQDILNEPQEIEDETLTTQNSNIDFEDFPATQEEILDEVEAPSTSQSSKIVEEIAASEEISTQQMNEIMDGSGSVGILDDTKTEEIESMIEEHLESSTTSAAGTSVVVNDKQGQIIEEIFDDSTENVGKMECEIEMGKSITIESVEDEFNADEMNNDLGEAIIEEPDDDEVDIQDKYDEDELLKDNDEEVTMEKVESTNTEVNESIELFATEAFDVTEHIVQDDIQTVSEEIPETIDSEEKVEELPENVSDENEKEVQPDQSEEEERIEIQANLEDQNVEKKEDPVPDTPSRPRRNSRVNYLELASMSPAKTPRRGRSASVESVEIQPTPKVARSVRKVLDPIVEDSIAMRISVQVDNPVDTFEIEVRGELNILFIIFHIRQFFIPQLLHRKMKFLYQKRPICRLIKSQSIFKLLMSLNHLLPILLKSK
jgi:hypothetical protein